MNVVFFSMYHFLKYFTPRNNDHVTNFWCLSFVKMLHPWVHCTILSKSWISVHKLRSFFTHTHTCMRTRTHFLWCTRTVPAPKKIYLKIGVRQKSKLSKPSKPSKPHALTWYPCNKLPNSPSWNSYQTHQVKSVPHFGKK